MMYIIQLKTLYVGDTPCQPFSSTVTSSYLTHICLVHTERPCEGNAAFVAPGVGWDLIPRCSGSRILPFTCVGVAALCCRVPVSGFKGDVECWLQVECPSAERCSGSALCVGAVLEDAALTWKQWDHYCIPAIPVVL